MPSGKKINDNIRATLDVVIDGLRQDGYKVVESNEEKPWGAYYRIDSSQADMFIEQYFPGLSPEDARLGIEGAELSPKILVVAPGQRLSWQYHDRRAERWHFLTDGLYVKSEQDTMPEPIHAPAGTIVQFAKSERHRLIGFDSSPTLVAEIWQHVDPNHPSNEDDITRLEDDYSR